MRPLENGGSKGTKIGNTDQPRGSRSDQLTVTGVWVD
jgi:hypothetical protein